MKGLTQLWSRLRSSLWFVPSLMVASAIGLAIALIEADSYIGVDFIEAHPRILGAGAEGARGMLSSIAGSMITVAGLTFSLTIVAMAQASHLYTSRILRTLMRDRANQFVLGYFVSIFVYCLIVLRTIRGGESEFVPSTAVLVALLLAIVSVPVLIFFIHHVARSLQASSIISLAAGQTLQAVERLFPQELGDEADESEIGSTALARRRWYPIPASKTGYIQAVDSKRLIEFAAKQDAIVRMERAIGDFVDEGSAIVAVSFNGDEHSADRFVDVLNRLYTISHYRTIEQDAAFGIRQLADIALKALSPAVNDQTTAIVCIDFLGSILAALAGRRIETVYRSANGEMQIIAKGPTFRSLITEAFDQLRDSAGDNVAIYLRLLTAIDAAARRTRNIQRRRILATQIELIASDAERAVLSNYNKGLLRDRLAGARARLSEASAKPASMPQQGTGYA
jgi:uncharacterized membrane protein